MNIGQFLILLSVTAILLVSYLIPQVKKKFFICISWFVCGIFLYNLFMSIGFDFDKYLIGEARLNRPIELFFSLNDDFTPEIETGYILSIAIALFTFMAGLLSILLNLSKMTRLFSKTSIPHIKTIYLILSMLALIYILPLPFFFSGLDFEYSIIHVLLIIPVTYFASSLYLILSNSFKWYLPLITAVFVVPAIVFLVLVANFGWITYIYIAIYIGFSYLGALCALIINKIIK